MHGIFTHENLLAAISFSCMEVSFSCMKFSFHDFFMHETFRRVMRYTIMQWGRPACSIPIWYLHDSWTPWGIHGSFWNRSLLTFPIKLFILFSKRWFILHLQVHMRLCIVLNTHFSVLLYSHITPWPRDDKVMHVIGSNRLILNRKWSAQLELPVSLHQYVIRMTWQKFACYAFIFIFCLSIYWHLFFAIIGHFPF